GQSPSCVSAGACFYLIYAFWSEECARVARPMTRPEGDPGRHEGPLPLLASQVGMREWISPCGRLGRHSFGSTAPTRDGGLSRTEQCGGTGRAMREAGIRRVPASCCLMCVERSRDG